MNSGVMVLLSELLFNQIAGRLIYRSTVDVDFVFVKTTDGALLWEKIDAGASPENWTPVTPSGGTWTEVDADGNIEIWTQMVV